MPATAFDRNSMARWYAEQHLKTDPGITEVYYLADASGEREIRFVEVNHLMGDRTDDILEPIDFGVDLGSDNAHQLLVLDVTPRQWQRMRAEALKLPQGWSLKNAVRFPQ